MASRDYSVAVHSLLIAVASLAAEHRFEVHWLQDLQHMGSEAVAHRPQNVEAVAVIPRLSCSTACGTF